MEAGVLSAGPPAQGFPALLRDATSDARDQLHLQPSADREEHRRLARGDPARVPVRPKGVAADHPLPPVARSGGYAPALLRARAPARRPARANPVPDPAVVEARRRYARRLPRVAP